MALSAAEPKKRPGFGARLPTGGGKMTVEGVKTMSEARSKKSVKSLAVTGKSVASVPGFVLVSIGKNKSAPTPERDQASSVVAKVAHALAKPGIRHDAVFRGQRHDIFSYAVDTSDISRVVRTSADGKRKIGRLVGDKFVPVKTP